MGSNTKLNPKVIAIDGPAGAGKSTIARTVAKALGFLYIDTGAIYRALTLAALRQKVDLLNQNELVKLAKKTIIELKNLQDGSIQILLNGEDVSKDIRGPKITKFVSEVSKVPGVRAQMLKLQRGLGFKSSCVLDGRDIGTVVFPDAHKKFFLDAALDERVNRRFKELLAAGHKISREDISADVQNRDRIDSTRECAPLKKAEDALYIDTTSMSIEQVVERVIEEIGR